jgi:predicted alpha/beta-hydrolase family hydrolase
MFDPAENAKALFVYAHGAGADKQSEFMTNISQLLCQQQVSVLRFNFPYMDKRGQDGKRYPPDRMPKLVDAFYDIMADELVQGAGLPVFIGGKSMGSRVAAMIANQADVRGVICLGYPFHPRNKPEKLRLEPLQQCHKPVLILQGQRDPLGNKDEVESYQLNSCCQLKFMPDGDHDLKPRIKSGFTHSQHLATAIALIGDFIDEYR